MCRPSLDRNLEVDAVEGAIALKGLKSRSDFNSPRRGVNRHEMCIKERVKVASK
jgi:hypothetical protein